MCLTIRENDEQQIAEVDIPCYKVLHYTNPELSMGNVDEETLTPIFYPRIEYTLGMRTPRVPIIRKSDPHYSRWDKIHQAYHTYVSVKKCVYMINLTRFRFRDMAILKCIIPKGTSYYVGNDTNGFPSFASEEMVIDSIVEIKLSLKGYTSL